MRLSKNLLLAAMTVALLGIGVPAVAAQSTGIQYNNSAGIVTLSTDYIDMRITGVGETPHFHWYDPNTPDVDYHVMFVKLFEVNDTNADGVFENGVDPMVGPAFALPTSDWDFSGFDIEETGGNVTAIHFNFTTTTTHDPRPSGGGFGNLPDADSFDVYVQIRVHMDMTNPGEIKFDLIIDGWDWTYDDSLLVFQFTVTESAHGQNQGESTPSDFSRTGTKFSFGNGYMEYEETALAAQNTLEVKASYGEGTGLEAGQSVYLAFENFGNETLEYDPILGVDTSSNIIMDNIVLIGVVGVVAILAIVMIVRTKK